VWYLLTAVVTAWSPWIIPGSTIATPPNTSPPTYERLLPIVHQQNILRFEIGMHQSKPVHKIQRVQQLSREIPDAVERERRVVVLFHKIVEGAAEALEYEAVVSVGQGKVVEE